MNTFNALTINFFSVKFVEDEIGVAEDSAQLPIAEDPLDEGEPLSYYIIRSFNVVDSSYFELDSSTGILTVVSPMDRDLIDIHTIKVLASRLDSWQENEDPYDETSTIIITIHVCIK